MAIISARGLTSSMNLYCLRCTHTIHFYWPEDMLYTCKKEKHIIFPLCKTKAVSSLQAGALTRIHLQVRSRRIPAKVIHLTLRLPATLLQSLRRRFRHTALPRIPSWRRPKWCQAIKILSGVRRAHGALQGLQTCRFLKAFGEIWKWGLGSSCITLWKKFQCCLK